MTPFILYQLKAGFCLMLFTGLYYLLFRKETFYNFNRFYLIGSVILTAIIPLLHLPSLAADNNGVFSSLLSSVTVQSGKTQTVKTAASVVSILILIYRIMALLFILHLLYQLVQMLIIVMRRGSTQIGDFKIITLPQRASSFSFFNLLFIAAPTAQTDDDNQVLQHEMTHARQWHTLDILLLQFVKIFQWFNPFLYLTEKALQETHEYLADKAVLEQDGRSDRYRLLLVTQVFGVQPGIFSFFNYSLIKNRLTMMTKEKSPLQRRFKYLAVLPVILLLGLVLCCNRNDAKGKALSPTPSETIVDSKTATENIEVDEQAKFQGGSIEDFREWVQKNLQYPEDAVKNGIQGKVFVQFIVNSKGKVEDVKILRSVAPSLDNETLRVIQSSPEWVAATLDGRNVTQQFVMPVIYKLQ